MGNCQGRKSSSVWAGDDWGNITEIEPNREMENLLSETSTRSVSSSSSSSSSSSRREVKIKITKRQLEELLGKAEIHDIHVDQLLSSLIDASDRFEVRHQRSWRPSLKSISELE